MKTTGFIYDESYFWHDNGSGALTMKAISGTITAQVHCI